MTSEASKLSEDSLKREIGLAISKSGYLQLIKVIESTDSQRFKTALKKLGYDENASLQEIEEQYACSVILALRLSSSLGQVEMGNKIGVSQGYISKIEDKKLSPSFKLIRKICQAYKLSSDIFFPSDKDLEKYKNWKTK